jgi:very-short-patch-repair endonuclease
MVKVPTNIAEIIEKHGKAYAATTKDFFIQDIFCEIQDLSIESPIEQALYSALKCVQKCNDIPDQNPEYNSRGKPYVFGLDITPQYKIDKYRADFYISFSTQKESRCILVECDSQEFHERNERERRYEKARDRHFVLKGFIVLHYTGKEILQDPLKIATEILSHVTGYDLENMCYV